MIVLVSQLLIGNLTLFLFLGCTENVNKSFGRLDITYTNKFDPYCNWIIRGTGITQAVAIVSINQIYFASSRYAVFVHCNYSCSGLIIILNKVCHQKKDVCLHIASST